MPVGKGFIRPPMWAPMWSIVRTRDMPKWTGIPDGAWVLVHRTRGVIVGDNGSRTPVGLAVLHGGDGTPRYDVFRRGREDYSQAWHQPLPWMDGAR